MLRSVALLLALWPVMGWAQDGNLMGRIVRFTADTWDDPARPYLGSRAYTATVGPGPEFGMVREGRGPLDVVPVLIDVTRNRIRFDYAGNTPGTFVTATFNGYTLTFPIDCLLIKGAAVEAKGTTLPLDDSNLIITPQSLGINVSGLDFAPTDTITIRVDVGDCPLS